VETIQTASPAASQPIAARPYLCSGKSHTDIPLLTAREVVASFLRPKEDVPLGYTLDITFILWTMENTVRHQQPQRTKRDIEINR